MKELKDVLRTVPEAEGLVGHEHAGKLMSLKEYDEGNEIKSSLQSAFAKLMAASKEKVSEALSKLIRRQNIESKVKIFLSSSLLWSPTVCYDISYNNFHLHIFYHILEVASKFVSLWFFFFMMH